MQEYSKFRVITAGFILMFIFVVAAMYTNTKDITAQKVRQAEVSRKAPNSIETINNNNTYPKKKHELKFEENTINNYYNDEYIDQLTNRVEQLERSYKLIESEMNPNPQSPLDCQVRGILDNGDVVPLSTKDSLAEANMNNKEIVITCIVK